MITELADLPEGAQLRADLCIVGAGAAGLLIADAFAGTGVEVVLLESGGETAEAAVQDLCDGEVAGRPFRGLRDGRARVFGGATTLWGGQCIPLDRIDFEPRSWVPHSGWPIGWDEMAPHWARAAALFGLEHEAFDEPVWPRFGLAPLLFDPTRLRHAHGAFMRRPDLGRRHRAKLRRAGNVRVLLHGTALRVLIDPAGNRATGVAVGDTAGRRATVEACCVVLCTGGLENARLLLLSDDVVPQGLGNRHGLVGRFFQDHPFGQCAEIVTDAPRRLQDRYNQLYGRHANYLPKLGLAEAQQRSAEVLNCVGRLTYEYPAGSGWQAAREVLGAMRRRRPPSPRQALAAVAGVGAMAAGGWRIAVNGLSPAPRPARVWLEAFSEQVPDPDNRVVLGRGLDALGKRRIQVRWRLSDLDLRTLRVFAGTVGEEFARLGLGEVRPAAWLSPAADPAAAPLMDSYHPAGTTRMAADPAHGVVDAHGGVFGVAGLFVAGSSVFPTSGAANPTLTIAALALRLADRLKTVLTPPPPYAVETRSAASVPAAAG